MKENSWGKNNTLYLHAKVCVTLHMMHPPQRLAEGEVVPCHQLYTFKEVIHARHCESLRFGVWWLHVVCYNPYPLGYWKWANPSW